MVCLVMRGERAGVADSHDAGVGEDFDDQPAVETETAHGIGRQVQQIHRVGAEMRLRRHGLAAPFDHSGSYLGNFHSYLLPSHLSGRTSRTTSRIIPKAIT